MCGLAKALGRIYLESDMNKWVCVRPNGQVLYTSSFHDDSVIPDNPPDGSLFIRVPHDADDNALVNSWYDSTTQTLKPMPPKPADGFYMWDSGTKSWVHDIELATRDAVRKRQRLLAQSDYTQLPDVTIANRQEWAAYRQELRDITTQANWPILVTWPTPPAK